MVQTDMKFVNTALSVIIYVPLTILGLYSIVQLYDFIYRLPSEETTVDTQKKEAWGIWASIEEYIFPLFEAVKNTFMYLKKFMGDSWFKIITILFLTAYFIGFYYFTFLYQSNETLKKYSAITNTIFILLGAFMSIGTFSLFVSRKQK